MTKSKLLFSLIGLIVSLGVLFVYYKPDNYLHIISCDVGQGDATLIIHKNIQILIDGGPGKKVLECLSSNVQFWDRQIELVVLTHPQADHYEGLISVFGSYKVDKIILTQLGSSNQGYQVLENEIKASGTQIINASDLPRLRSDLIHLDILHPSSRYMSNVLGISRSDLQLGETTETNEIDPNRTSVVVSLSFGKFDAIFTGDIGPLESDLVAERLRSQGIDFEYIKIPHHGSRNGIGEKLIVTTNPEVATISSGKNNSYGHPHEEVLDLLDEYGVRVFRTDLDGEVEIVSDGARFWVKLADL